MNICPSCKHSHSKPVRFCKKCGTRMSNGGREEKKARLTEKKPRSWSVLLTAAVVAIAAGAVIIYFQMRTPQSVKYRSTTASAVKTAGVPADTGSGSVSPSAGTDKPTAGDAAGAVVTLPIATIDDGKAHFFSYRDARGVEIKYFVLKSSDGVIRAAFDACDVCYPSRRGYRQEGDEMICNNCGQRFPSTLINEVRGGCNPAPLDRRVDGDQLVLQVSDILKGALYF